MKGLRAYDLIRGAARTSGLMGVPPDVVRLLASSHDVPVFLLDDVLPLYNASVGARGGLLEIVGLRVADQFSWMWMEWSHPGSPRRHGCIVSGGMEPDPSTLGLLPLVVDMATGSIGGFMSTTGSAAGALVSRTADGGITGIREDRTSNPGDAGVVLAAAGVCVFALALLECKNVGRRSALLPRAVRRHGPKEFAASLGDAHFTLDIPGSQEFRQSVDGMGEAQRKRLHIVRGHFANYTEEAPLFGKHVGRFYHPPHVRGSADRGTITKDYRVVAPA